MQPTDVSPEVPSVDPEMAQIVADFNQRINEPISLIPPILVDLFVKVGNRIVRIFSQPE